MSDARDLYQEALLNYSRQPRNRREMPHFTHQVHSENPACGDQISVFLHIDDHEVIRDISFTGHSCAIATASASLMTEVLIGKTAAQARVLFDRFHEIVTGGMETQLGGMEVEVERLTALACLRDYPEREQCATLAWHTMLAALESAPDRREATS